jgi:hypothetical protein
MCPIRCLNNGIDGHNQRFRGGAVPTEMGHELDGLGAGPYPIGNPSAHLRRDVRGRRGEKGGPETSFILGGPRVRIPFPPAESQVRTCLSREFAFLGRESAVFCGCPGPDERPGSAETRGAREHLAERR